MGEGQKKTTTEKHYCDGKGYTHQENGSKENIQIHVHDNNRRKLQFWSDIKMTQAKTKTKHSNI